MDIKKIVSSVQKPWYVPAFIWNLAVNKVAGIALEHVKVHVVSKFAAEKVMGYIGSAVKDYSSRETACRVVSRLGSLATSASDAISDGVITDRECKDVGDQIQALLEIAVDQDAVDRIINEAREGLMA